VSTTIPQAIAIPIPPIYLAMLLRCLTRLVTRRSVTAITTQPLFSLRKSRSLAYKVNKPDQEWKRILNPEEYYVCRQKGTERAFTGKYWDHHEKGIYSCVACGQALFDSATKFDSGTGWPSFYSPIKPDAVETEVDHSMPFMPRTEIKCSNCGSHLGHVFDDGPAPSGQRYCMNSVCLSFNK
jgi:peptide-methionine (R)-S-oxide reductase